MTYNGYTHIALDHCVAQVRAIRIERSKRLGSIRTRKQALAYQADVRRSIHQAFLRPRPRKTPLNARVTGIVERPTHRIETVLFDSRPGCMVTGNLYIPYKLKRPAPAVISPCGHRHDAKNSGPYQQYCQRLVRNGFVVFIYDPINQGERDQYFELSDRSLVDNCCDAHNMMGKQLELLGDWFGNWRAWDGIRALDYLLSRSEVDRSRVGITGNSGGGTMTTWLWAVEPRLTMAAPNCFITTFLANLENELTADAEQYPPGVLGAGLEMADFLIARAPDPLILLAQAHDYFDRRGLHEAHADVRRFYRILGAPEENLALSMGSLGHSYPVGNQEDMIKFFARHTGIKRVVRIPATETVTADLLNATPKGEVITAGAVPVFKLIGAEADRLAGHRESLTAAKLKKQLHHLLNLPRTRPLPHYRILRGHRAHDDIISRYAVETESEVKVIIRKCMKTSFYHTLDVESEVHLYLPHISGEDDMANDSLAITLRKKHPLYTLDVRGLGESLPDDGDKHFFHSGSMDYLCHGYGFLLGQSFLGCRVYDILTTLDLLVHEGARKVHLYGRGQGALLALFAGLLHPKVTAMALKNAPLSYRSWLKVPIVRWPTANIPWGIYKQFDIPDCLRALGNKVRLIQPWGPDMKPLKGQRLVHELKANRLSPRLFR